MHCTADRVWAELDRCLCVSGRCRSRAAGEGITVHSAPRCGRAATASNWPRCDSDQRSSSPEGEALSLAQLEGLGVVVHNLHRDSVWFDFVLVWVWEELGGAAGSCRLGPTAAPCNCSACTVPSLSAACPAYRLYKQQQPQAARVSPLHPPWLPCPLLLPPP